MAPAKTKLSKRQSGQKLDNSDRERLKALTRRMLDCLEERLAKMAAASDEEAEKLSKGHEWLVGKASFPTTLALLAELLIQLEQSPENSGSEAIATAESHNLSSADQALVEAFIVRIREENTPV